MLLVAIVAVIRGLVPVEFIERDLSIVGSGKMAPLDTLVIRILKI